MGTIANPFYSRLTQNDSSLGQAPHAGESKYAKLPRVPVNSSPVPRLTSLYHHDDAGTYGSRAYPGNCGGKLIRNLLLYFKPSLVCDSMSGSGTGRDVCAELHIRCLTWDIHQGQDACEPNGFASEESFDFIWAHPPYWRQNLYATDERDLSRAPTLQRFLFGYGRFIRMPQTHSNREDILQYWWATTLTAKRGLSRSPTTPNDLHLQPAWSRPAPTLSASVTGPVPAGRFTGPHSSPACMTPAWCSASFDDLILGKGRPEQHCKDGMLVHTGPPVPIHSVLFREQLLENLLGQVRRHLIWVPVQ